MDNDWLQIRAVGFSNLPPSLAPSSLQIYLGFNGEEQYLRGSAIGPTSKMVYFRQPRGTEGVPLLVALMYTVKASEARCIGRYSLDLSTVSSDGVTLVPMLQRDATTETWRSVICNSPGGSLPSSSTFGRKPSLTSGYPSMVSPLPGEGALSIIFSLLQHTSMPVPAAAPPSPRPIALPAALVPQEPVEPITVTIVALEGLTAGILRTEPFTLDSRASHSHASKVSSKDPTDLSPPKVAIALSVGLSRVATAALTLPVPAVGVHDVTPMPLQVHTSFVCMLPVSGASGGHTKMAPQLRVVVALGKSAIFTSHAFQGASSSSSSSVAATHTGEMRFGASAVELGRGVVSLEEWLSGTKSASSVELLVPLRLEVRDADGGEMIRGSDGFPWALTSLSTRVRLSKQNSGEPIHQNGGYNGGLPHRPDPPSQMRQGRRPSALEAITGASDMPTPGLNALIAATKEESDYVHAGVTTMRPLPSTRLPVPPLVRKTSGGGRNTASPPPQISSSEPSFCISESIIVLAPREDVWAVVGSLDFLPRALAGVEDVVVENTTGGLKRRQYVVRWPTESGEVLNIPLYEVEVSRGTNWYTFATDDARTVRPAVATTLLDRVISQFPGYVVTFTAESSNGSQSSTKLTLDATCTVSTDTDSISVEKAARKLLLHWLEGIPAAFSLASYGNSGISPVKVLDAADNMHTPSPQTALSVHSNGVEPLIPSSKQLQPPAASPSDGKHRVTVIVNSFVFSSAPMLARLAREARQRGSASQERQSNLVASTPIAVVTTASPSSSDVFPLTPTYADAQFPSSVTFHLNSLCTARDTTSPDTDLRPETEAGSFRLILGDWDSPSCATALVVPGELGVGASSSTSVDLWHAVNGLADASRPPVGTINITVTVLNPDAVVPDAIDSLQESPPSESYPLGPLVKVSSERPHSVPFSSANQFVPHPPKQVPESRARTSRTRPAQRAMSTSAVPRAVYVPPPAPRRNSRPLPPEARGVSAQRDTAPSNRGSFLPRITNSRPNAVQGYRSRSAVVQSASRAEKVGPLPSIAPQPPDSKPKSAPRRHVPVFRDASDALFSKDVPREDAEEAFYALRQAAQGKLREVPLTVWGPLQKTFRSFHHTTSMPSRLISLPLDSALIVTAGSAVDLAGMRTLVKGDVIGLDGNVPPTLRSHRGFRAVTIPLAALRETRFKGTKEVATTTSSQPRAAATRIVPVSKPSRYASPEGTISGTKVQAVGSTDAVVTWKKDKSLSKVSVFVSLNGGQRFVLAASVPGSEGGVRISDLKPAVSYVVGVRPARSSDRVGMIRGNDGQLATSHFTTGEN